MIYTHADSRHIVYFDQIKEVRVGWAGSRGGNGKCIQNFMWEKWWREVTWGREVCRCERSGKLDRL